MKNTHHKFILILPVFILMGGIYFYFNSELKSEAASSPLSSSRDLPSLNTVDPISPSVSDSYAQDIAFLSTLGSLKKINIDTSIFESQAFRALNYNVVIVEHVTPGRNNPFLPVGNNVFSTPLKIGGLTN